MGDDRVAGNDRVEIAREDAWAEEIAAALPLEATGITNEAQMWRHAMRVYLAEHGEDFR